MQTLLKNTAAYKIFCADKLSGRLSHAYMVRFDDVKNMRAALKLFAAEFFGEERRVINESLTDLKIYPAPDGKITADGISSLIEDSAMRPVEGDKKLYVIEGFDRASALVQNKLLKTLEEPPVGVHFILGVSSLAPVLDTVKSRVKLLEIPPFSQEEILSALSRRGYDPLNAEAAKNCNGVLGVAEELLEGGKLAEVTAAAREICRVTSVDGITAAAKKYGDTKYKTELLSAMRNCYFSALCGGEKSPYSKHALIYALELISKAEADVKFNAFFQGLLYDFMLKVISENTKWQKLRG